MRAARRTLALQLFILCTCTILVTCSSTPDMEENEVEDEAEADYEFEPTEPYRAEDHIDDMDTSQSDEKTSMARKLWDCVEDNNTLTCMKDLFYEEFDSKVMRNHNLVLLKRYINKYMEEYMKRKRISDNNSKYSGFDLLDERQDTTTAAPVDEDDDDDGHRGMKQKMMDFLPYLLAPALLMAGVMPWVIPPLKMMVMFVAMINQFAFSSALFSLVRNYVFNRKEEEHVFYINHGYQNQKHR
ncbi:uncharacterized protein [Atheta coriaria]|uniref:uncharacterized protein n=1 Tax=Dalotia coriaria TaxID=877792 RepID=UPI0031F39D01